MNTNIICIVAVDIKGGIAKNGKIPWKSKTDMKFFKDKTLNNIVIMGNKTFETLNKPLVNRKNIVITNNKNKIVNNVDFVNLEEAYNIIKNETKDIYIIGGNEIYKLFMKYCNKIYITVIKNNYDCDMFFDNFNIYLEKIIYDDDELTIYECKLSNIQP